MTQLKKTPYLYTSESVSDGHPDKLCDRISDSLLDLMLSRDPQARCAIEVLATTGTVIIAGEVRCQNQPSQEEIESVVREVVRCTGYIDESFRWDLITVQNLLHAQSQDIAMGVDEAENHEEGAGDQGLMFGYACQETETFMPAPLHYSNQVMRLYREALDCREDFKHFGPDSKVQLSFLYENGVPKSIKTVVMSLQHENILDNQYIHEKAKELLAESLPSELLGSTRYLINPTGRFVIGGPVGDSGLTGRKIIVDSYGGSAPHGGGAFSGKDATKVDRSGAYIARYIAKNIIKAGLAERCLVQLSYAIGVAEPTSLMIDTFGTSPIANQDILRVIEQELDLTPKGIRTLLELNQAIYAPTAAFGHFGRRPYIEGGKSFFTWENDQVLSQQLARLL